MSVQARVPIVGIGASAGGVKALQQLFEALPDNPGAAFVVVVHLDPNTRSELAEILATRTKMPVRQVTATAPLQKDCVYIIPPGSQLRLTDHEISPIPFTEPRGQRAPIDVFFRSLATQDGDGLAIVLTGAGSDGAAGVKAVKEAGGIVLVQEPEEAEHSSMPRAAIATESADFILPLEQIAERLVELIGAKRTAHVEPANDDEQLRRILAQLRARTGHDFSHYKRSTVTRRVMRRVQVARKDTVAQYATYLNQNGDEAQALLSDLLISVTNFFRDPAAFDALAKTAIPAAFTKHGEADGGLIRIWVAGCATGEEAYSIAMLLLEEAGRHTLRPEIQLFASDLDSRALAIAREGRYPAAAVEADLTEERVRRYFTREGDYLRVKRELRDIVLFANHSILKDPPFSRLDIVSCRNLLIYLERDLQQQVLSTLHYGLNPDGYLLLGSSESADHPENFFRAVDRDARLYQSIGRPADRLLSLPHLSGIEGVDNLVQPTGPLPTTARAAKAYHREALETLAPPSILVDETLRVVHLSENAGRYLQPSAGPLTPDITDLVRPELRFELRSALHRAFDSGQNTLSTGVMVSFDRSPGGRVYLQVKPSKKTEPEKGISGALILFIEGEVGQPLDLLKSGDGERQTIIANDRLKEELEITQLQLRTMREESEAANEELRAANEELQSINEEYRSTAEELETSKEELQSINEELQTVNSELKVKLETVSRSNSDLQNLMAATDFATLFLDPGLRIKRFTPKLADIFNVTMADIGRPITDFTHQLEYNDLPKDAKRVLDDLAPIEKEVRTRGGGSYEIRLRPYRTVDDKIDGVVVTFLDVSEPRRVEDALRTSEKDLHHEIELGKEGTARQALLLRELTHRVKNTLTVIQGIIHQSWRHSVSAEDFIARVNGRIAALAEAHKLLVDSEWHGADLQGLVESQLAAYVSENPSRLHLTGPQVMLSPDIATPFGLVLHELATNAAKYGALSGEKGTVDLTWTKEIRDGATWLNVIWRESGGPKIEKSGAKGLGTRLITEGLSGSEVQYTLEPGGAACRIVFPLGARG